MEPIVKSQLPNGNRRDKHNKQLPITAVDKLADELVLEYQNPDFKRWYCSLIYKYGPSKVDEWRVRASEGNEPAKLFSKYAKDYRKYNLAANEADDE